MKPLIIGICGIKRSGSTVMYNLVRLALEMAGYDVTIFGHDYNPDRPPKEDEAYLCKRHPFHRRLAEEADHIFLTDRPDNEILDSLEKFNGFRSGQSHIDNMRVHLDKWKGYARHPVFDYKEWKTCRFCYVHKLVVCLYLNHKVDAHEVFEAFNEIEPPESGKDPVTLLFSNHITSK